MRIPLALLLALLPVLGRAQIRVEVQETDPASPSTLGHWERFDLHIQYETDRPIQVRADAFLGGRRVTSITSGSPRVDAGRGEALFWFAYTEPARVDSIVVRAEDPRTGQALAELPLAVDLRWTGEKGSPARTRPEWVARLQAAQDQRIAERTRAMSEGPLEWLGTLLVMAALWSVPGYFVVQGIALWRTRGRFRMAASLPLLPMGAILIYTVFALVAGSNLFPLFLIFAAPPALAYLVVVLLLFRQSARRQP